MKCSECEYWDGQEFPPKSRICSALTKEMMKYSPNGLISCTTGDDDDPFITTQADFGCILFKKEGKNYDHRRRENTHRDIPSGYEGA